LLTRSNRFAIFKCSAFGGERNSFFDIALKLYHLRKRPRGGRFVSGEVNERPNCDLIPIRLQEIESLTRQSKKSIFEKHSQRLIE
jgi:hypothetical protein